MDFKRLRYFLAIAECQSFASASRKLHIAQPALTRQVHALEEELGIELFIRSTKGVTLTDAGRVFYEDIKSIFSRLSYAEHRAKLVSQGSHGELKVGITTVNLWIEFVAIFFKRFRANFPNIMLNMNSILSGEQVKMILNGVLDIGLLYFPPKNKALDKLMLHIDKLVLVTQEDSLLAQKKPKKLKDIDQSSFVWFERGKSPNYHDKILAHFNERKFSPNIVELGSDNMTMLSLVSSGVGCTIVPKTTASLLPPGIVAMELDDLDLELELMLVWRQDTANPSVKHMVDIARQCALERR